MFTTVSGTTGGLADVEAFAEMIRTLDRHPVPEVRSLFAPGEDVVIARAPGRLDVMGGIADYSGSLVLEMPTAEATLAAVQKDATGQIRVVSLGTEDDGRALECTMSLSDLMAGDVPISYERARALFRRDSKRAWAAYVVGVLLVLMRERGVRLSQGVRILIKSDVPEGKGVSSSAALEVATAQAVVAVLDLAVEPYEMAMLCQKVENLVVGAPCGVMDQMTAVCGRADELLSLLCQPAQLCGFVSIPESLAVWGLDSGERHAVAGADYGSVRVGAFMGYRIIADLAGLAVEAGESVRVVDPTWAGYLANITPATYERSYASHLPDYMTGRAFEQRYGGTTDPVTTIDPDRTYPVRTATAHPIHEHARVQAFAELLEGDLTDEDRVRLGELMVASHASYSACGLGSRGTDLLVSLVRQIGVRAGLYGAKITGGGSGGTVAVLGRRDASEAIARVGAQYADRTGHQPYLFRGSSPGAAAFGVVRLASR